MMRSLSAAILTLNRTTPRSSGVIRLRSVGCALLVLSIMVTGTVRVAAQENLELYRRLAVDLSQRAAELHDDDSARRELAQRAANLDPTLGDPLVVLARFLEDDQEAQLERERMLARALAGEFVTISRREAVGDMAELLLQQNRSREALALLDSELAAAGIIPLDQILGSFPGPEPSSRPVPPSNTLNRLDRLYIDALLNGDAPWLSGGLLQRLRSRFPMDRDLGAMDWRRGNHTSLAVLEWIDAVEQLAGHASPVVYRELLRGDPPQMLVPALLDRYDRAGGDDPLVHAVGALHHAHPFPAEEALLSDKLIWELFHERLDRSEIPEPLEEALAEMRGGERTVLTRDLNRDGFWEERYTYHGEELSLWQSDADQDGRATMAMSRQGPTTRIAVRRAEDQSIIVVEYSRYPLVSRVRWVEAVGVSEWMPAQPVPVDVGLPHLSGTDLWNGLGERVTVTTDLFERFRRQRQADEARALAADEERRIRRDLQEWGLIE